jgi:hypothetical protein
MIASSQSLPEFAASRGTIDCEGNASRLLFGATKRRRVPAVSRNPPGFEDTDKKGFAMNVSTPA